MARGGRKDLDDLFQNFTDSALLFLGLVLVAGIGIWIVSWIRSRFADDEGSATEDQGLLSQIAELREQGDLSEEEYRSIKGRLVERLNDSMSANEETPPRSKAPQSAASPDAEDLESETRTGKPQPRDASDG